MATVELLSLRPGAARQVRPLALLSINVAGLLFLAILFRAWDIGNTPGLNGDEAWSGIQSLKLLHGEPIEWRTPTGNPLNVFFFLPQVVLHAFFAPSFALLRTVSLVSGLAAVAVNYGLCRKAFDPSTAILSSVLLAVLPINIAYSRFAWDASQSLLATLPVLYLPLIGLARAEHKRWYLAAAAAYVIAILVHPTNILAAPLIVAPWLAAQERVQAYVTRLAAQGRLRWWLLTAMVAAILGALVVRSLRGGDAVAPVVDVPDFVTLAGQLFSGTTIYRYIPGLNINPSGAPRIGSFAIDLGFWIVAAVSLYGYCRQLRDREGRGDRVLVLGWLGLLLAHFALAGPAALRPGLERYSMVLIGPTVLVIARGAVWWLAQADFKRKLAVAVYSLYAWLALATFSIDYFGAFQSHGGTAHLAFRTAPVEPKLQALEHIASHRRGDLPIVIYTDDWWLRRPLEYLAWSKPGVRVATWSREDFPLARGRDGSDADVWFVEFVGSARYQELVARLGAVGAARAPATVIKDSGGADLIAILRPSEEFLKK